MLLQHLSLLSLVPKVDGTQSYATGVTKTKTVHEGVTTEILLIVH